MVSWFKEFTTFHYAVYTKHNRFVDGKEQMMQLQRGTPYIPTHLLFVVIRQFIQIGQAKCLHTLLMVHALRHRSKLLLNASNHTRPWKGRTMWIVSSIVHPRTGSQPMMMAKFNTNRKNRDHRLLFITQYPRPFFVAFRCFYFRFGIQLNL